MKKLFLQTCWGWWEAQQKVKERWCEGISCIIEGVYTIGLCISRILSEKIYSMWIWKIGIETHRRKFSTGTRHHIKIRESKGPSRGILLKCAPHERSVLARPNSEKYHMRRPCTKKDAPAEQRGIGRKILTSSRMWTNLRFILVMESRKTDKCWWCGLPLRKVQRSRIRSRFRSINAHDDQKRLKLRWIGYLAKIQNTHCGTHSQWRSAYKRGLKSSFTI